VNSLIREQSIVDRINRGVVVPIDLSKEKKARESFATASLWELTHSEKLLGYIETPGYLRMNLSLQANNIVDALTRLWWSAPDKAKMSYKIELMFYKHPDVFAALDVRDASEALSELRNRPAMAEARKLISDRVEASAKKKAAKMAAQAA